MWGVGMESGEFGKPIQEMKLKVELKHEIQRVKNI